MKFLTCILAATVLAISYFFVIRGVSLLLYNLGQGVHMSAKHVTLSSFSLLTLLNWCQVFVITLLPYNLDSHIDESMMMDIYLSFI